MLKFYCAEGGELKEQDPSRLSDTLWIDASAPTPEEVEMLHKALGIQLQDLADSLDPNERSRVEIDEDYDLLVLRSLIINTKDGESAQTMPVGIFLVKGKVLTVRIAPTFFAKDLISDYKRRPKLGTMEDLFLAIIRKINRDIDRRVRPMEGQISHIQKSLLTEAKVEFTRSAYVLNSDLIVLNTTLLSNYNAISMLSKARHIELSEDQADLLEDIENDVAQLYDMTTLYREIISNVLRAHESVISNNLSTVMKILTTISLALMLPTLIASLYGMNIGTPGLPFFDYEYQFWVIIAITAIAVLILWVIFRVKRML
jgi:magnesium transporter